MAASSCRSANSSQAIASQPDVGPGGLAQVRWAEAVKSPLNQAVRRKLVRKRPVLPIKFLNQDKRANSSGKGILRFSAVYTNPIFEEQGSIAHKDRKEENL